MYNEKEGERESNKETRFGHEPNDSILGSRKLQRLSSPWIGNHREEEQARKEETKFHSPSHIHSILH